MMVVVIDCGGVNCMVDTAVKGKVLNKTSELYLVDFSDYAKKQGYIGDWSEPKPVDEEKCIEDKK
jgi:hypothetical protein